jgi:hypothetical protein
VVGVISVLFFGSASCGEELRGIEESASWKLMPYPRLIWIATEAELYTRFL